jgi:SAM-dependent methyltransferase
MLLPPMREACLDWIACPACHGELKLVRGAFAAHAQLDAGLLECAACSRPYDVTDGVPRLTAQLNPESDKTAKRFGAHYYCNAFDGVTNYQAENLAEWLHPVGPKEFAGKVVYEAGCGKGRHSVVGAAWGARALVALDLSDAVDVAYRQTRHLHTVHLVQGDLLHPPVRSVFDIAFSVDVLHHLPAPRDGLLALASALKPGGTLAIRVYGYETNEWVVRYVDPLRKNVTSKLPGPALYWMTLPSAVGLTGFSKLYKLPELAKRLPMEGYFRWLAELPLREVHNIVFDQLTPPVAHYLPESEVRSWFKDARFGELQMGACRDNGWRVNARWQPAHVGQVSAQA